MAREFFEIAFIIPFASRVFPQIKSFLKTARTRFKQEELPQLHIFSWIGGNSVGVVFRFSYEHFVPSMIKWFAGWIQELRMEIIELENFGRQEKEAVLKKFEMTSDVKFTGNYNLDHALNEVEGRFSRLVGMRREQRLPVRLTVKFRTGKALEREYSENISYGGMFIRGRTDLPLRTKLEVVFKLPGTEQEIKAVAEVVHIVSQEKVDMIDGDRVPGSGVHFIEFIGDGEEKLRRYIEQIHEQTQENTENKI
ncbi:MAG: PilZ domain-containing protein [Proteobacteria bacterium]|nr:PilZ domain-containing protein [Pseudomonadota bacterium]